MANTNDLRFIRTEKAIRDAFMALISETPVSSITASAVCRTAGISRNAFYLHYASIAALYSALVNELVADLRSESFASAQRLSATGNTDYELSKSIVGVFAKHEQLLRALTPADDGSLAKRLAHELENAYVDAALMIGPRGGSFEHRMNCAFAAWAHVGLVTRWIAETDRPIADSRPLFESLQAGLSESSTRFLTE